MSTSTLEGIKSYWEMLNAEGEPLLKHAREFEQTLRDVESRLDEHLRRLVVGTSTSFDTFLADLKNAYGFDEAKLTDEISAARDAWVELEQEWRQSPEFRTRGRGPSQEGSTASDGSWHIQPMWNPFASLSKCGRCKLAVSAAFIAVGGVGAAILGYTSGAAAPAYFTSLAAAVGISVTALYAILGMVVAGTITVSGIPREICRRKGKC
jgi:hypothetical protein